MNRLRSTFSFRQHLRRLPQHLEEPAFGLLATLLLDKYEFHPDINLRPVLARERIWSLAATILRMDSRLNFSASCTLIFNPQHDYPVRLILCRQRVLLAVDETACYILLYSP
jgi:hypothetical protein